MLVYPDSSDLIRLERDDGGRTDALRDWLQKRNGKLVLSGTHIVEIAQPLHTMPKARVMLLLQRLENLPHTWFRSVDLEQRELEMAIQCFTNGDPWQAVSPFVGSYLEVLAGVSPSTRAHYHLRPLPEVIWDLMFGQRSQRIGPSKAALDRWLTENRAAILATDERAYQQQLHVAFRRAVLTVCSPLPGFASVRDRLEMFVDHLWSHPDWCPASRLSFDVAQLFQADIQTKGRESDLEDLVRVKAIPYVDVFVADASKRAYLQALRVGKKSRLRNCTYWHTCSVIARLEDAISEPEAGSTRISPRG